LDYTMYKMGFNTPFFHGTGPSKTAASPYTMINQSSLSDTWHCNVSQYTTSIPGPNKVWLFLVGSPDKV
jgi:hypothetical protein